MKDYPNAGNYGARPGRRQGDTLPFARATRATRFEPLSDEERHFLWEVCNRCLADEPVGKYVDGGRSKVAQIVAEEMKRRNPRTKEGCSHVTISNYISGAGVHPVRREAIRAVLPALVDKYYPEDMRQREAISWERSSVGQKLAAAYEKLPAWRRKLVAQAAGLIDDDGNSLI